MKKTLLVGIALMLICSPALAVPLNTALPDAAQSLALQLSKRKIKRIAVLDATSADNVSTSFGILVAEELLTALFQQDDITVVDRLSLNRILQEQKLTQAGLVSNLNAIQRIGNLAGVDSIIVGTYFDLGSSIRLTLKALDVKTAQVYGAVSVDVDSSDATRALLKTTLAVSTPTTGNSSDVEKTNFSDKDFTLGELEPNLSYDQENKTLYANVDCKTIRFVLKPNKTIQRIKFLAESKDLLDSRVNIKVNNIAKFSQELNYRESIDAFLGTVSPKDTITVELSVDRYSCRSVVTFSKIDIK